MATLGQGGSTVSTSTTTSATTADTSDGTLVEQKQLSEIKILNENIGKLVQHFEIINGEL